MTSDLRARLLAAVALIAMVGGADAQSRRMVGYSGALGEWELTAELSEKQFLLSKQYSGPLTMRHVGICTQDGPETKTGEVHLKLPRFWPGLDATIEVAGVQCRFTGKLSILESGTLTCPDRRPVPMVLWLE